MSFDLRITGDLGSFVDTSIKDGPSIVDGVITPFRITCERCDETIEWDRLPEDPAELRRELVDLCVAHRACGGGA